MQARRQRGLIAEVKGGGPTSPLLYREGMTDRDGGGTRATERAERAELLKERIYVTFTSLAVTMTLLSHAEEVTPGSAALTLVIAVVGTLLAVFVADFISHLAVHSALPSRRELAHMARVSFGSAGTIVLPLVLMGLAAAGVLEVDDALRVSTIVLLLTLVAVGYLAVRRARMPAWLKLVVLFAEVVLGVTIVALELLAHG